MFEIIGEQSLKTLCEAREAYHRKLDDLDSFVTRRQLVSCIYEKHKDVILQKRGRSNVGSLIYNEFYRKVGLFTVFVELPYEDVKAKFRDKGYIKGE